ncbi:MAG: hypothetical protein GC145_04440 [Caulobacter sp.]|nr:hypothetical protein [Caulobacter sp.]
MRLASILSGLFLAISAGLSVGPAVAEAAEPLTQGVSEIPPEFAGILSMSLRRVPESALDKNCMAIFLYKEGDLRVVELSADPSKGNVEGEVIEEGSVSVRAGSADTCGLNLKLFYGQDDILVKVVRLR